MERCLGALPVVSSFFYLREGTPKRGTTRGRTRYRRGLSDGLCDSSPASGPGQLILITLLCSKSMHWVRTSGFFWQPRGPPSTSRSHRPELNPMCTDRERRSKYKSREHLKTASRRGKNVERELNVIRHSFFFFGMLYFLTLGT